MKHYKHKLNMLEPGIKMLAAIGISIGIGILFRVIRAVILGNVLFGIFTVILSNVFFGLAAVIGLTLFILLMIEHHQDKIMNNDAIKENKDH